MIKKFLKALVEAVAETAVAIVLMAFGATSIFGGIDFVKKGWKLFIKDTK